MAGLKILLTTDPEIPVPPEFYGGAERLASDLINEYTQLGHQVYLIANEKSSHPDAVNIFFWPTNYSRGWKNILKNAFFMRKVYKKVKPDVLHCFSRILYQYPLLFSKAKFVKRYGRFISPKSTTLAKIVFGNRIQFIAAANHMLKHLKRQDDWRVIYNFVDTNFYVPKETSERNNLLFIGRIEEIKGVHEAIQVAKITGEPLIIAGNIEPEHKKYFETKVQPFLNDSIKYIGIVNNEQKRNLFQTAKATLFPIKWEEPFGIVMAESLACGTPVIAFERGSVPEVIKNGENGFICKTVKEMADCIPGLKELEESEIRGDAIERFSRQKAASQYIGVFSSLINK